MSETQTKRKTDQENLKKQTAKTFGYKIGTHD